jgi:hypothetical protein
VLNLSLKNDFQRLCPYAPGGRKSTLGGWDSASGSSDRSRVAKIGQNTKNGPKNLKSTKNPKIDHNL